MSQEQIYTVCVAREVVESVVVKVTATSQDEANEKGLRAAENVPADAWGACDMPDSSENYVSWSEPAESEGADNE